MLSIHSCGRREAVVVAEVHVRGRAPSREAPTSGPPTELGNAERQARDAVQFHLFVPAWLRVRSSVVVAGSSKFRKAFVSQSEASSRPCRGALRTRG